VRVALVNPPNNYDDTFELAPPLGVLSLAAVLREDDVDSVILDFNLWGVADHAFVDDDFYGKAVAAIGATAPDIVGFTSMVVNSHVAIELARQIRSADRDVIIVFGGTHFSAIAEGLLGAYDWIDFVVKGEGEIPFRGLVEALRRGKRLTAHSAPAGVAFRDGGSVVSSHLRRPFEHADALPWPAYDLVDVDAYFALNPDRVVDYEPGRGCVYKCAFCYSPVHYGPGAQAKSAERVAADMQRLHDLGARHVFFVQDNFLNNARTAAEICDALAAAALPLTWNCYTTLPQMTPSIIAALGRAGCVNAFTGIDAVNEDCQREYLKHFYRGWEPLERTLRSCTDHGVTPTCAFLVENPSGGVEPIDRTLVTALFARCCGAGVRLNTLTLYNGTASEAAHGSAPLTYSERKPRLLLDCPPLVEINDYARARPALFPFHSTYLDPLLWERFTAGMHAAYTLFHSFPMTLYRWVTEERGSLWTLCETIAGSLPDLTTVEPALRRPLERETFVRWFGKQPRAQRLTAETFELEQAELEAWTTGSDRVTALGYGVADLHRFDLHERPQRGPTRPLLVRRNERSIEYVALNGATAPAAMPPADRATESVEMA